MSWFPSCPRARAKFAADVMHRWDYKFYSFINVLNNHCNVIKYWRQMLFSFDGSSIMMTSDIMNSCHMQKALLRNKSCSAYAKSNITNRIGTDGRNLQPFFSSAASNQSNILIWCHFSSMSLSTLDPNIKKTLDKSTWQDAHFSAHTSLNFLPPTMDGCKQVSQLCLGRGGWCPVGFMSCRIHGERSCHPPNLLLWISSKEVSCSLLWPASSVLHLFS